MKNVYIYIFVWKIIWKGLYYIVNSSYFWWRRKSPRKKTEGKKASFPSSSLCSIQSLLDASDWQNLGYMPTSKLQGDGMWF